MSRIVDDFWLQQRCGFLFKGAILIILLAERMIFNELGAVEIILDGTILNIDISSILFFPVQH